MKEGVIVDTQHVAFDGGVITVPAAGAVATAALVVLVIIAVVVTVVIVASEASDMINQAHEWIEVLTESKVRQEAEIDIIVEDMFDGWVTEKESREDNIRELERVIEDLWKTIDDFLPGGSENPDGLL
jgi:predicted PurR-regulated permease PerM